MKQYEQDYVNLIIDILDNGERRVGRNGTTISVFGKTLEVDMTDKDTFPLLMGRKIFYQGVAGELAAFFKGPKHINDFEAMGCNYWKQWAEPNGDINVDYGNSWKDFNGVDQMSALLDKLKNNPNDRRMLISGWNPANLAELSLPSCHILYQWYVSEGGYLDMVWYQRSVDTMVGLPSDVVLAATWNALLANECGYKPGKITMMLGDTHIYKEHIDLVDQYIIGFEDNTAKYPLYELSPGATVGNFTPHDLSIEDYNPIQTIKFEVKA